MTVVSNFLPLCLLCYLVQIIEPTEKLLILTYQIYAQVISGIEAAVRSMKVGGIRRVIIPPSQGYQSTSQEPIPPNVFTLFSSNFFSFYSYLYLG